MSVQVILTSHYGLLSRGRHSARRKIRGTTEWAEKDVHGNLVVTPGIWDLHSSGGFSRTAKGKIQVDEDGGYELVASKFSVVEVRGLPQSTPPTPDANPTTIQEFVDQ